MHRKCPPHDVHPGVFVELCKAFALTRVLNVDDQHRHGRRSANKEACAGVPITASNEEKPITAAGLREHDPLRQHSILVNAHDMVFGTASTGFTVADGIVCPRNHGIRWTAVTHEGMEVSPHRRHGQRSDEGGRQ